MPIPQDIEIFKDLPPLLFVDPVRLSNVLLQKAYYQIIDGIRFLEHYSMTNTFNRFKLKVGNKGSYVSDHFFCDLSICSSPNQQYITFLITNDLIGIAVIPNSIISEH